MTEAKPPKVFISHATEDKSRFVQKFAETLRANGVDAWYDQWEMLPGDSVVDKIFEEGIKGASAFIVVLSATSVSKPWVREELNAGFVRRLAGKCRIIPIVLDACEVPECLRSTLWQRIDDPNNYPDALKRILNSIFGLADKPPLGTGPVHAGLSPLLSLPSLQKVDSLVFEVLCEESVRADTVYVMDLTCLDVVASAGVTDEEIRESLTVLRDEGYVELFGKMGASYRNTRVSHLKIRNAAFDTFARAKWTEYDSVLMKIVSGIINDGWRKQSDIAQLCAPSRLCDHLIRMLETRGSIKISRSFGEYSIWEVSPKLKRAIAGL